MKMQRGLTKLRQSRQLMQVKHVSKVFHRNDSISIHISCSNNYINFIV
jgi:hypothetical protein